MLHFRSVSLFTLFVFAVAILPAAAELPSRLIEDDGTTYKLFQSKPARELMGKSEFHRYQSALTTLECGAAGQILRTAFTRAYPEYAEVAQRKETPLDLKASSWERYASVYFKEYGFCSSWADFSRFSREMLERGLPSAKYQPQMVSNIQLKRHPLELRRNTAISRLVSYAASDYPPALIKLAELVRNGDLFDVKSDVELYLIERACFKRTCAEAVTARVKELRSALSSKAMTITYKAHALLSRVDSIFRFGEPL